MNDVPQINVRHTKSIMEVERLIESDIRVNEVERSNYDFEDVKVHEV
jgi:hypothetical protein